MAWVSFTVTRHLRLPAQAVFDELVNWQGHADWVPMTRVVIESGDGGAGTTFVATSGLGPLALPDRMRVVSLDSESMQVHIVKVGPVLTGDVHLSVAALSNTTCEVAWLEEVRVPLLPKILARPVAAAARKAFAISLDRMARGLRVG